MKFVFALAGLLALTANAVASSIVERNPFDPQRKNWPLPPSPPPAPPPPLPMLTPQDIAVEAIILFGDYRGILAQLSGKLKDSLPANAAGKVRIAIGQNFGPGYVLSRVEAKQVVIDGRGSTSVVPLVRRTVSGVLPAAAAAASHPFVAATAPAPAPAEAPAAAPAAPSPATSAPLATDAAHHPAPAAAPASAPAAPAADAAADQAGTQAGSAQPTQPAQPATPPMTLLDAIRAAQERAKQSGAAPAPKLPFGGQ